MTDLFEQADQPQVQYIPEITVTVSKSVGRPPRGPNKRIRPEIPQPLNPFIRHIPLTKGQYAVVDTHLYDWLMHWNWYAQFDPTTGGFYAGREETTNGVSRRVSMHGQIMGVRRDETRKMDHKNRDSLDNTGCNLRYATDTQSCGNRSSFTLNTSGYKGVTWYRNYGKWLAQIQFKRKNHHLGYFAVKEDAARAYDRAAILYFGEFAVLNFPRENYL